MNLREKILQSDDLKREAVEVSEWGATVYVQVMPSVDRDAFETACLKDGEMTRENFRARLAAWTVVDEQGRRVFTDGDAELLGAKSGTAMNRLFPVALRLNRMGKADVEELVGNSESGRGAASPSASPSPSA